MGMHINKAGRHHFTGRIIGLIRNVRDVFRQFGHFTVCQQQIHYFI